MTSSEYFINQELVEEMVRLNRQATIVTNQMGGTLPEQGDPGRFRDILDLACGPGEWVHRVALEYPDLQQVVGVDQSRRMIAYASAQAEANGERAVSFRVMDITQPLDFADATFDLVNARFLLSFMKREQWSLLLSECYRVLRPGGVLRVTEQESGFANDPIYQQFIDVWGKAWREAGHAFALTNAYLGVTIVLKLLMQEAGFVELLHRPISIDLSTGQPIHREMLENFAEAHKLASSFLLKLGVSKRNITTLSTQMESLINKKGFCAYWLLQTVWSQKPGV